MYFSIHNHTHYSNIRLLDSINKPKNMIQYARKIGLKGIVFTEHECLSESIEVNDLYKDLIKEGSQFKIAIGNEIYLTTDRTPKQKYFHFLLIAKDDVGHVQLRQLSTTAWYNGYNDRGMMRVPTLYSELKDVVSKNKGHLIASTACRGSMIGVEIFELIKAESRNDKNNIMIHKQNIINYILFMKDLFGDDFYLECQPNKDDEEQNSINKRMLNISKAFNVKMIFSTDSHYLKKEDRFIHEAFLNSKESSDREVGKFYNSTYMMSFDEIKDQLSVCFSEEIIEEMRQTTLEIMDKIKFYDLSKKQTIMAAPVVIRDLEDDEVLNKYPTLRYLFDSQNNQEKFWVNECLYQLKEIGKYNEKYLERLETEADVIKFIGDDFGMTLFSYFNNLHHYVEKIWEVGSIVGTSRGSACCYLSNMLLGITQIDPLKYNLPYWRFLNKGNIGTVITTDVDIDLNPLARNAFIEKMKEEVGEINCVAVGAFGTITTKSAINVGCRGYRSKDFPNGIDNDVAQYIASLVHSERGFLFPLEDELYGNEKKGRTKNKTLITELNKYPGLTEILLGIEGLIDKRTRHAAGIVISENILDYSSVMRTPRGELITAYSLYPLEQAGLVKMDILVTDACSKITTTINMLQEYGEIPKELSLKEAYYRYLSPDVIDENNPELWKKLDSNSVMDLFQFNSNQGLITIQKAQPKNITELAASNAIMRLMAEKGGESPIDRYMRLKSDMNQWYNECYKYKLNDEQIKILEKYYLPYYGCICLQESLMEILMDENIANFTLAEANAARKVVAKKQMNKIEELREKIFEKISNQNLANYVWDTGIKPQLGYSFSLPHCLGYGWIAMQEAYLTLRFPEIYWNTACLCVNAGTIDEIEYEEDQDGMLIVSNQEEKIIDPEDEEDDEEEKDLKKKNKTVRYGKIAKALGMTIASGIKVSPPNINTALKDFVPDVKNNEIIFSLKALRNVGDSQVDEILSCRPFKSLEDYLKRTNIKKPSTIALIKAGAFDSLENKPRKQIMEDYVRIISSPKSVLNMRNLNALFEKNLIPLPEFEKQRTLFAFNKYLKQKEFKRDGDWYLCDEPVQRYLMNNYITIFNNLKQCNNELWIDTKAWKKVYDKEMLVIKNYIIKNQQSLLDKFNKTLFDEIWNKYCIGSISKWEMDSMSFYWHDHELKNVDQQMYQVENFTELPEEPVIDKIFTIKGRDIPMYKLTKIYGTCIDKDNIKRTFTLLTPDGAIVPIKLSNEHYALYNRQLSEIMPDGTKKVREKSWFTSGNKIMVIGFRRGDSFVPKKYKNSLEKHRLLLITKINNNRIEYTSERYGGQYKDE